MSKEFPATLWYSNIGVGDGQDIATRGYLNALVKVGYEWVIAQPDRHTFLDDPELDSIRHLFSYPKQFRHERPRVQAGDPRIGKRWPQLPDEWEVGAGSQVVKWDNIIRENDVDHDIPIPGPDEKWQSKVDLVVLHFDPGKLARIRDAMARQSDGSVPIVGITAWETDRIPAAIAQQLSDLDLLICPSEHTASAMTRSGFDSRIEVVHHALDIAPPESGELRGKGKRFVFYTIGTNIERKNLRAVIAAYIRAFHHNTFADVGLVIKTSGDEGSLKRLYKDGIALSKEPFFPKIAIYGEKWPESKIRELHEQCDCWVDATRGEGFGLPQASAVIAGNPIITTGWGSQVEIVQSVQGVERYLTNYSLVPVDDSMAAIGVYRQDQLWADPDIDDLAEIMREVAGRGRRPKQIDVARATAEKYSLDTVGRQLSEVLNSTKQA